MRICLILSLATISFAAPVSREMAARTADAWISVRLSPDQSRQSVAAFALPEDTNPVAWLVPLSPEGFVLLSADDALRPVLGWSDTGTPSPDLLHPGLQDFLNEVSVELARTRRAGSPNAETRLEWDRVVAGDGPSSRDLGVLPLLTCTWDQGAGWNAHCPQDGAGPAGRVYAGCVATSMAQVMHYWQQPWQGVGAHGYMSDYGWLEANFANATYDWSQIQANNPTAEAAQLLYHCGIAVDMMYAPDGSGAYVGWGNPCALTALREHFTFQSSAQFIEKSSFTWANWRNRLKQDLNAARPILHSGFGSGGHAFNLDGWREDDYFHLNWGWSGSFNGWFLIDALSPGGNDFSQGQGAIVNLVPGQYQQAPQPLHPLNNAEDVDCTPAVFQWIDVPGALGYDLVIDDSPDFRSPEVDLTGLTGSSLTVDDLLHFSQYYWRIRSQGAQGAGPWSPTAGFLTSYWDQTPSPAPATPLNGAVNVGLNPTVLVWNFVAGAQNYRVQVAQNQDFSALAVDTLGVLTHYLLLRNVLEPGQQYWWRVQCEGLAGTSEWSVVRTMTTQSTGLRDHPGPSGLFFEPAWPNPFNPATRVNFRLEHPATVDLTVYNLLGEKVATLLDGLALPAGLQRITWLADGLPSGSYLLVLRTDQDSVVQRVTLMR